MQSIVKILAAQREFFKTGKTREIDFRIIGFGTTGQVARAIQRAFHAAIHGQHPRSKEWLTYVDSEAAVILRRTGSA